MIGSARRLRERITRPSFQREIPAQMGTRHRGWLDTCGVSGTAAPQSGVTGTAPSAAITATMTTKRAAPHTRVIQSEERESEAGDERLAR